MAQPYWLFGTHVTILADEQQTNKQYDLVEGRFSPGAETPPHLHTKYSELIYVLEGEFTVYTDTGVATLADGGHIFIPMNTPHSVVGSGEGLNRAITVASPSGFANLIRSVGTPGSFDSLPPDQSNQMGLFMKLSEEIGDVLLGPPGTRPQVKTEPVNV